MDMPNSPEAVPSKTLVRQRLGDINIAHSFEAWRALSEAHCICLMLCPMCSECTRNESNLVSVKHGNRTPVNQEQLVCTESMSPNAENTTCCRKCKAEVANMCFW